MLPARGRPFRPLYYEPAANRQTKAPRGRGFAVIHVAFLRKHGSAGTPDERCTGRYAHSEYLAVQNGGVLGRQRYALTGDDQAATA
jgi:hypothetical protein